MFFAYCFSVLFLLSQSTEEKIIYSNVLIYSPEPSADGVLRLDGATVPVECQYEK